QIMHSYLIPSWIRIQANLFMHFSLYTSPQIITWFNTTQGLGQLLIWTLILILVVMIWLCQQNIIIRQFGKAKRVILGKRPAYDMILHLQMVESLVLHGLGNPMSWNHTPKNLKIFEPKDSKTSGTLAV